MTADLGVRDGATRALYEGSLAEPGVRNPYAGRLRVLAKARAAAEPSSR